MPRTIRLAPGWRAALLSRKDLPVETVPLAQFLIGKLLVHRSPDGMAGGRIVETEAYPPGDAAGHGFIGETRRNRSLFLDHGYVYIYRAYGTAWMLNFSSEGSGVGAGVLIRAIEPLIGMELMRTRRPQSSPRDLARGPGRLTAALGIDLSIDGTAIAARGPILLADDDFEARIGSSVRIGITRNANRRWRYFQLASPFVSGPRGLNV
jgi:DNA-3-methyladenine glycosylase